MTKTKIITLASLLLVLLNGCSMAKLTVRASMPIIEGGIQAINMETDLILAEAAFPPNIELIEGMLINDPGNQQLHEYAAQAYYGYAYGFVEDTQKPRASRMYMRGLEHGKTALRLAGVDRQLLEGGLEPLQQAINDLDQDAIGALFWTASNWAKWIDLNRDQVGSLAQLPRAVALMQRTLELDEHYFNSGPHIFFGVYYGSRSPMLGGDFEKSARHFQQARLASDDRLLIIDVLQAEYLQRQKFDRAAFHRHLTRVVQAPQGLYPEQGLINSIAKHKAGLLLAKEEQWF
jgi:hypothetical protein